MKGEFPDMKNLPSDLLNHFKQNADKMASLFTKMAPVRALFLYYVSYFRSILQ